MILISPILKLTLRIFTFAIYLLTACCAFGGYISPHVFALPSAMVLGLPYMVILTVVLIIMWCLLRGWITAGLGVVMLIACWTPVRMLFPFNTADKPTPGADTISILTWNVGHGKDFVKPDYPGSRTFEAILKENADIVCLQELMDFAPGQVPNLSQSLYDSICTLYPYRSRMEAYDVQLWSKYPFQRIWQKTDHYFGNIRMVRFDIKGHRFMLCNVHLPSYRLDDNEQKILSSIRSPQGVEESIRNFKNGIYAKLTRSFPIRSEVTRNLLWNLAQYHGPVIVVGDFNDVPASWTYRLFLKDGFKDAYTATNFFSTDTFYNNMLFFHIDQVMYRGMVKPLSVDRIDVRSSDHYGLKAVFEFEE